MLVEEIIVSNIPEIIINWIYKIVYAHLGYVNFSSGLAGSSFEFDISA